MEIALAEAEPAPPREDGVVHLGDLLQIRHAGTDSVLSYDVEDKDARASEDSCAVTAASSAAATPCARNTWYLEKYESKAGTFAETFEDDVLHYGQMVKIVCNPKAKGPIADPAPLYLYSKPVTTTHFAKLSRQQEIGITSIGKYDAVWKVLPVLPADRLVLEGQPVPVGEPVVFQHSATKQNLNLTNENYFNDFGQETEVSGYASHSIGKAAVMENMKKGMVKSDLDKPELAGNHWRLCSS